MPGIAWVDNPLQVCGCHMLFTFVLFNLDPIKLSLQQIASVNHSILPEWE